MRRGTWLNLAGWLLGAMGAVALMAAWLGNASLHTDFAQNVWLPARLVLDGINPYNPPPGQVSAALGPHAAAFTSFNSGTTYHFIYPLWLALLFTPLALVPLPLAITLWRGANLLILVWSTVSLLRVANPAFGVRTRFTLAGMAVAVLLSIGYRESIVTLYTGQFSILELALFTAISQRLLQRADPSSDSPAATGWRRDLLSGLMLAVLATKPQATGLPVALIGLWSLARRRWGVAGGAIGGIVVLLLIPAVFYPWSLPTWLDIVFHGQAQSQVTVSASVWGVSYQLLGGSAGSDLWVWCAWLLTAAGLAATVPWFLRDLRDPHTPLPTSLPLFICINSLISPYLLGYEHVLLLLPALFLLGASSLPDESAGLVPTGVLGPVWCRVLTYGWLTILSLVVAVLQTSQQLESPAILQSGTMLLLLLGARLRWDGTRLTRLFALRKA